ncbi:hypothetical protein P43SY_003531 [Pythium insidiosum]|uniref:B30.2/SPRY domain-containing protein n=1 Tax=Pythium insidiosum TaxID=114742 RepID=A0AAD5QB96_PYTIN|nr:hypothetical protein P43SY_003531 [Pythium insidiosum]
MMMFGSRTGSGRSTPLPPQRKVQDIFQGSPENQSCADCTARLTDSVWASTTVGAFLCIHCAGAHRKLGVQLSRVKSMHLDAWSEEDVPAMKGGNKRVHDLYAKFLDKWLALDPSLALSPNAETAIRERHIRLKYEAIKFAKAPTLQDATPTTEEKGQDSPEHPEDSPCTPATSPVTAASASAPASAAPLSSAASSTVSNPTQSHAQHQQENQQQAPAQKTTKEDSRESSTKSRNTIELSKRFLNYFVVLGRGELVPNQALERTKSPADIQFHPAIVDVYPEHYDDSPLPSQFAQFAFPDGYTLSPTMAHAPGPVFCPKCIVVTSHYPYFSAFRQFLQQIYRLTLSEAPMPIERYIANFVSEVPLPPPGQIQVQLTLPDRNIVISRPPRNDFPLVDFSFRPLFQALDINNVLQLFTCAVLEYKAPVPFIVGIHADCMKQAAAQASGVIFVDLDHNRVIPAVDESGKTIPIPKTPEREGAKLRAKLFEYANSINQKLNRSLTLGKKKYDCSFLDDKSDDIRETFIAPPPSNIGLPDDGSIYRYKSFPRLKKALFGNVRKPRELFSSREQQRNVTQVDIHQRIFALSRWKEEMFEAFRRKIFDLWEQCDVPLLHRSKFWLTFNRADFFNLGIFLEEERRLQAYFRETHAQDAYEYSTQTHILPNTRKSSGLRGALHHIVKPKGKPACEQRTIDDVAGVRVVEERRQLYNALKRQTSESVRESFYQQFGIPLNSKKKKRRLSNLVWTSYDEAGVSAEIRIREDLAFTVNAALKSIRYASPPESSSHQPKERELVELQHQVRMLAAQNHRLAGELKASQREASRLQMELQLQTQPQLRKVNGERSPKSSLMAQDCRKRSEPDDDSGQKAAERSPAKPHAPTSESRAQLMDLSDDLLALLVSFLAPRDVEAATVASRAVAFQVLPRFPIWRALFCYRWEMLNFELPGWRERDAQLTIDHRLRALFPSGCTESRMFQLLAHGITPVPSYADLRATRQARRSYSSSYHSVVPLNQVRRRRVVDFAYGGQLLGGDRCVRANVPFGTTFRVAVYASDAEKDPASPREYIVSLVAGGYFEISITKRQQQGPVLRHGAGDMTAVGLALSSFRLVEKQPGWDSRSIGYHGDDGNLFSRTAQGQAFSVPFGPGDTVGCGIRRDLSANRTFVYFTNNGDLIPSGDMQIECSHADWFPVVGLDSMDAIHINFGQEPFKYSDALDAMLSECEGQQSLLTAHAQWYDICESDAESSSDDEGEDDAESEDSDESYDPHAHLAPMDFYFSGDDWSDSDDDDDYWDYPDESGVEDEGDEDEDEEEPAEGERQESTGGNSVHDVNEAIREVARAMDELTGRRDGASPATGTGTGTGMVTGDVPRQIENERRSLRISRGAMQLPQLSDELLAGVLGFLSGRDVEACAVASRVVALDVLPRFPIWRALFVRRWSALNFALPTSSDGRRARLSIDRRLRALFPTEYSDSRIYQILTHAITRAPSLLDVRATQRAAGTQWPQHRIEYVKPSGGRGARLCSVALTGRAAEGNRMIRANAPFTASGARVAVVATSHDAFVVGLVAGGYVEISRSRRDGCCSSRSAVSRGSGRPSTREMVAIGVATQQSRLTQNQPGWDGYSLGLHSDDGGLYSRAVRRRTGGLSAACGAHDTLGCGVRQDLDAQRSFVFFTHNSRIATASLSMSTVEVPHRSWFPVVGLDTDDVVHVNFGQEPFVCSDAVEALLQACDGRRDLAERLPWHDDLEDSDEAAETINEVTTAVAWDAWAAENSALVSLLVASEQGNLSAFWNQESWTYAVEVVTAMAQRALQTVKAGAKSLLTQRVLRL